jgi:hypothetical protein
MMQLEHTVNTQGARLVMLAGMILAILLCDIATGFAVQVFGTGQFQNQRSFDYINLTLYKDRHKNLDNEAGDLAWGASYAMMAYAYMYDATKDVAYLDMLGSYIEAVLKNRDSEVGKVDYRGLSLPGWGASGHYSIGYLEIPDTSGKPALAVQTAYTGSNNETFVEILAGSSPDLFTLAVSNKANNMARTVFKDVSMDPGKTNYVVKVVERSSLAQAYSAARLKVVDLQSGASPAPMTGFLEPPRYLWPVHQGMITYPIVTYARFVYANPTLAANPNYVAKAERYVQAVEELMYALEHEWRQNDAGEGWYSVAPGAPVWMDGVDEPFNHFLAVGRTMVQLAAVTGKAEWRDKATAMALTFKNDLKLTKDDAYTWSYWWSKGWAYRGWGPNDKVSLNTPGLAGRPVAEDTSHGSIDLHFAYLCYKEGIVFDRTDMERFTRTFLNYMADTVSATDTRTTLNIRVDGSGAKGDHDYVARHWQLLAEFDPQVAVVFDKLYSRRTWTTAVTDMLNSAIMNYLRTQGLF